MKAIYELSEGRDLDLKCLLEERYFGKLLEELTITEAGQLINWLQKHSQATRN